MKKYLLPFVVMLGCVFAFHPGNTQPGDPGEGSVPDDVEFNALKDLYDLLGGSTWANRTGWPLPGNWPTTATSTEMAGWFGITVSDKDITQIRLGNNNLVGILPESIGNLTSLTNLYLYNNQISGALPPEMGNLSHLIVIQLYGNQLSGSIPITFGDLALLVHLHLGANQLSGQIPAELGNLTMLTELYLYDNQLTGTIPQSFSALTHLHILSLEDNDLSGSIPIQLASLTSLEYLYLNGNQFSGSIPSEIGSLGNLLYLRLDGNQLTGAIPSTLGNLSQLQYLRLASNPLTGPIPASLGNLSSLTHLYLYNDQLSGNIPPSLGNLSNLLVISLYGNQLTGPIPAEFGNLTSIWYLHLGGNQLSGTIPAEIGSLANLSDLYLYDNNIDGEIPESMGNLSNIKNVDLSYNQLGGSIPASIGNLDKLISLQLNYNNLTGNIPSTLGNLSQLEVLYLQNNKLEGDVPSSLCSLPKVTYIFLSDNYLTGLPNFYTQVNKVNLDLRVYNNYLSFGDLEPLFNILPNGIKTFVYSPQRTFRDVLRINVPEGGELNIQPADPGANSTITWEKQTGSTWQNVNSQSEDATLSTYKISNATSLIDGTYRWKMTNSKVANLTLESEAIAVEAVDPLPTTVSTRALYNGLITAARWRTDEAYATGDGELRGMYIYNYDEKYQLKEANWADPLNLAASTNLFRVTGVEYDPNGNIQSLKRYDAQGVRIHNFTYEYNSDPNAAKTNQLELIPGYATYGYNSIGQMTAEDRLDEEADDQYTEYDVSGKVRKVYSDAAETQLKVEFIYDDRGFRLAKVNHDQSSLKTTWYIRDASGNIISVYEQDGIVTNDAEGVPVLKTETLEQTEVPIYGAGKLGTFYPDEDGSTAYEITDHLGNVRALVRDNIEIYTATMEDNGQAEYTNPRVQEMQFFQNLFETEVDDANMNHTSPTATTVSNPSMSAYLFWQNGVAGMDAADKAIGPAAALRVNPGDRIELETWVRYRNEADYTNNVPLLMLSQLLGNTFAGTGGFEGYSATQAAGTFESALGNGGFGSDGTDETRPYAYLNFILFDDNLQMLDAGWQRVPVEAGFDPGQEGLPDMHEKVEFPQPIQISSTGYIYIWVSNESENTRVWFDDLRISHSTSLVTQATDYGVWGDVIREEKTDESVYRFGYQGQFAEKDEETGWNAFELRQYDAVIGRWTTVDPKRIGFSPYIGMYNNPVNGTDSDGGGPDDWYTDTEGNLVYDANVTSQVDVDRMGGGIYIGESFSDGMNAYLPGGGMLNLETGQFTQTSFIASFTTPVYGRSAIKGYDYQKAIDYLTANAEPAPIKRCAAYVRTALEAGGLSTNGRPESAKDYDALLPTLGFKEVPVKANYVPMAGDIVVMQNTGEHVHGHIQMYNGEKWVSDYSQSNFWPYKVSRPTYQVFR